VNREIQACILGGTTEMRGAALSMGIANGAHGVAMQISELTSDLGGTNG